MNRLCEQTVCLLERLYERLLAVYPVEFRGEYAAEMVEFFASDCRRAARLRGLRGVLGHGGRTFWDLIRTAPAAHMEIIGCDLRIALRSLLKDPSFSLTVILTLALGLGANTAIFSMVHAILVKALPFAEPDRLVMVWEKSPRGIDRNSVSAPNFLDYRARSGSLAGMAAFFTDGANLSGGAGPDHVPATLVTADFFGVLGVAPVLGTPLGGPRQVVLSYGLWQRRFGGDAGVIGRVLRVNGAHTTICGIMPESFVFPSRDTALWTDMPAEWMESSRQAHFLSTIARLKPGFSLVQARAELGALSASLAQSYPVSNRGWGVTMVPLKDQTVGDIRRSLLVLMGAVGFILLIACANVANLLIARGTRCRREMAIRSALGASSSCIYRQMLTESVLLALLGAVAGLLIAGAALLWLKALHPAAVPRLGEVTIDGAVLGFAIAIALLTGIACALGPALEICRRDLQDGLKESAANRLSFATHWGRGALIGGQIALSLLLMVGAGLLIRTLVYLQGLDPGFEPGQATSFTIDFPQEHYPNSPSRAALVARVLDRLPSRPGVESAGVISSLPLTGGDGFNRFGFTIEGSQAPGAEDHRFYARWISPGYLTSMAIPLLQGRDFTADDRAGSRPAVIVDAALARRHFPNQNPVGKFLRLSYDRSIPRQVVGVVGEVRMVSLEREPAPTIYIPLSQEPRLSSATLVVRSARDWQVMARWVTAELHEIDASLPVYDVRPLDLLVAESIAPRRFNMLLMTLLAVLAAALAAVGVYSVISYLVGERQHEIGVRMALGARPAGVLALVIRQGIFYALPGILIGLAAALLLTKTMSTLLFGVRPFDVWTYAAVALLTVLVVALACLPPALRASRVDPATALRAE